MQILIGVDLARGGCEWLVDRGVALATASGGRIDLAFVGSGDHGAALQALLARVPEGLRGTCASQPGDVVETLCGRAREYDVLVVGPREPSVFEMMIRGSYAMRIVRAAPCAVYVPKRDAPWRTPVRCLVGVDVHATSHRITPIASRWALRLNGRLDLLTAERAVAWAEDPEERERLERAHARERANNKDIVDQILEALDPAARGSQRFGDGKPEDVLVDLSEEYDLVMVGNAPREGLGGSLRWSIGEAVVRAARCDVLTLPTR